MSAVFASCYFLLVLHVYSFWTYEIFLVEWNFHNIILSKQEQTLDQIFLNDNWELHKCTMFDDNTLAY